uniref:RxLR effector candidate protein n=1 Tax=Hyaloperonospora arabidopsidis (strain Emoy2) TaxID=559515 RepID=M4BU24_HYAAE
MRTQNVQMGWHPSAHFVSWLSSLANVIESAGVASKPRQHAEATHTHARSTSESFTKDIGCLIACMAPVSEAQTVYYNYLSLIRCLVVR